MTVFSVLTTKLKLGFSLCVSTLKAEQRKKIWKQANLEDVGSVVHLFSSDVFNRSLYDAALTTTFKI